MRPRERRKRRKTKLTFGRLRSENVEGAHFVHAIKNNERWIRRWENLMLNLEKFQVARFKATEILEGFMKKDSGSNARRYTNLIF